jgi:protein phosphatase-4 regulatory subunit 3
VLIDKGVFGVIEQALAAGRGEEEKNVWLWVACLDVLTNIGNHDPGLIRAYVLGGKMDAREALLGQLVDALTTENVHSGIAHQLFQLLRVILDSDTMQTADKDLFLDHVYKSHMIKLVNAVCRPVPEVVPGRIPSDDETASAYHSCELLSFCFQHHSKHGQRTKSFAIQNNMLPKVVSLLTTCKRPHLMCAALRFLRVVIALKDEKYLREIVKKRLLDSVMELFVANGARYNLINSVIIELVNFIRVENLKTLIEFLVKNHEDKFRTVHYVQTFNLLKLRWEQNEEYKRSSTLGGSVETNGEAEADALESERSEYEYFAGSDDENDTKIDPKKLDVDDEARFNSANEMLRAKRKRSNEEELLSLVAKRKPLASIPAGARSRKVKPGARTQATSPVGFFPRFANAGKRDGS